MWREGGGRGSKGEREQHICMCLYHLLSFSVIQSFILSPHQPASFFLQISSLKAELGRPCEIPRQPPPLPVKPSEEPPQQLPLSSVVNKSSVGDDDAFEEGEPSPVAPCPYLSFVPLQDDPRARHKKVKDKEGKP